MNVILVGAGRGSRLMPLTAEEPKCFTRIGGRRILDWTIEAFRRNGPDRFVFVGGYLIDVVRQDYPDFLMVENAGWQNNNILFSLLYARNYMSDGFYSSYTDTLFRPQAVEALKDSPYDITVVMDTKWRERYRHRSLHPEQDAEKMVANEDMVTRMSRAIPAEEASGEFTGLLRMTAEGAAQFLESYDRQYAELASEGPFAEQKPYRMAYLIHQLDHMIQSGVQVHCVRVPGKYFEIDTLEDYQLASNDWAPSKLP